MSTQDFSWVRWDRLRWQFVEAMITATQHTQVPREMCTCPFCIDLARLLSVVGLETTEGGYLDFRSELEESVTLTMRDGMSMVSTYIKFGSGDPLEGFMEVPESVGEVIHSEYFSRGGANSDVHSSHEPVDTTRELLYAFTSLAFPNEFLELVHRFRSVDGHNFGVNEIVLAGTDAYAELRRAFDDHGYVSPNLSSSIVEHLSMEPHCAMPCTEQFILGDSESGWSELAGYGLEFGMNDASLQKYWEGFPSIPDAFCYTERNNGYHLAMGIVCRSDGFFVSQQVGMSTEAESNRDLWNHCTRAFNQHLAPVLQKARPDGVAMVVFSNYRDSAYIVSSVESSWDEYASVRDVLGPLPEGFGIVGVWSGYDKNRYTPRSLDDVIEANWSEQITASAKYLRDCLKIVTQLESE